jgi:hypothetical protein
LAGTLAPGIACLTLSLTFVAPTGEAFAGAAEVGVALAEALDEALAEALDEALAGALAGALAEALDEALAEALEDVEGDGSWAGPVLSTTSTALSCSVSVPAAGCCSITEPSATVSLSVCC